MLAPKFICRTDVSVDEREILESVAISSVTPLVKLVSRPLLHLRPGRCSGDTAAVVS